MNKPPRSSVLEVSPLIALCCVAAVLIVAVRVVMVVPYLGARGVVVDFDAFYLAGVMFWEGDLRGAYDVAVTKARQSELAGVEIFMPWAYPPQFNLLTALLPYGARGVSYFLFITLGFGLYLWGLRRLAGPYLAGVLFVMAPAMLFNTWIGQNGFVTGAFVAMFAYGWLHRREGLAGVGLGLMVIKPHLALALGVLTLATPRWRILAWAFGVVGISSLISTLAFGTEVWGYFLSASAEASRNIQRGLYPLFRMTSVYAALHTSEADVRLAMGIQAAVALCALALTVWLARYSRFAPHRVLGLSIVLTLLISPYNYDYDLPLLAAAFAVLARDLSLGARGIEKIAIMLLTWGASSIGLVQATSREEASTSIFGVNWFPVSYGALFYLPLAVLLVHIIFRLERQAKTEDSDQPHLLGPLK